MSSPTTIEDLVIKGSYFVSNGADGIGINVLTPGGQPLFAKGCRISGNTLHLNTNMGIRFALDKYTGAAPSDDQNCGPVITDNSCYGNDIGGNRVQIGVGQPGATGDYPRAMIQGNWCTTTSAGAPRIGICLPAGAALPNDDSTAPLVHVLGIEAGYLAATSGSFSTRSFDTVVQMLHNHGQLFSLTTI